MSIVGTPYKGISVMSLFDFANDFVDNEKQAVLQIWKVYSNRSSVLGLMVLCEKINTVVNFVGTLTSSLDAVFLLLFSLTLFSLTSLYQVYMIPLVLMCLFDRNLNFRTRLHINMR